MAEPSSHINYSFEDIQRYLQGKMNAAEMHAIEKAALQDPFLADAIEGFNEADLVIAQQHLDEINATLTKEKKESKVVAFNKRTQWMNVAALIIVLAGIGVVASYFFKSSNKQSPIAQVKKEPIQNNIAKDSATGSVNAVTSKPDTTLVIAQNKPLKKTVSNDEHAVAKKNVESSNTLSKNVTVDDEDKADVASIAAATVEENKNYAPIISDTSTNNLNPLRSFAAKEKTYDNNDSIQHSLNGQVNGLQISPTIFSGKVVDVNGNPVPFATIRVNDKESVAADATGFFSLKNKDTSLFVTTSAVGYANNASIIKPVKQNIIRLNENNIAMNEAVVTTALGVSKKPKSLGYSTMSDSAQPVGGWENFNHYVITQLNQDSTKENYMSEKDKVELEFLIDKAGNPYNITIVKPLDDKRNSKAIDILKSGPKWTGSSNKKKAKVSIAVPL